MKLSLSRVSQLKCSVVLFMVIWCMPYFENDKRQAPWIVVCHIARSVVGNRQVFSAKDILDIVIYGKWIRTSFDLGWYSEQMMWRVWQQILQKHRLVNLIVPTLPSIVQKFRFRHHYNDASPKWDIKSSQYLLKIWLNVHVSFL